MPEDAPGRRQRFRAPARVDSFSAGRSFDRGFAVGRQFHRGRGGCIFRRWGNIGNRGQELGFDLGDFCLHRLAALDCGFDRQVGIGLEDAVKRGESRSIDPLAKRPVLGIALLEGVADRFFDRVQAGSLCTFAHIAMIVSRRRPINQRACARILPCEGVQSRFRRFSTRKSACFRRFRARSRATCPGMAA